MSFGPKTIEKARTYRYNKWAGNPQGRPFQEAYCMAEVYGTHLSYQCSAKAKKDGFCMRHHPDKIAEKEKKREEKYQQERERNRRKWALQSAAPDMLEALEYAAPFLPQNTPEREMVEEAIRKAKGEA